MEDVAMPAVGKVREDNSAAEKARLVAAIEAPGAVVTEIARKAGVDVSLLYRWRRRLADERETPAFVPLRATAARSGARMPRRGSSAMR
jgi:transposase-like protein